ncbi:zinc ABC transporter substrate-binding protein [Alkalihalobacillus oceani]|uniref:metal ABC transporter solute-binding protein, Zn/Mn family n=1 Tax=Halalkalibacter oceani TaxID=1653776 RepID=UPI00203AD741|nr:zinc ABC transporter substrate-binding protein [Halalkalibacter oceani]MCM3760576.1 zinc ABC transporter substrate-binding protein [Halalkalibacter oceani]
MKNWLFVMLAVLFGSVLAACNQAGTGTTGVGEEAEETIKVVTTIAQIGEPLSVIGGEHVEVNSLMGPSVDPHLYNATQGDIATLQEADVIFYNGLDLEVNMVEIFNQIAAEKPVMAIGDTISEDLLLEEEDGVIDPHIWFDIRLWKQALEAAVEELKAYAPDHANDFEANKDAYFAELDELQQEAAEKLGGIPEDQRVLVTAHDAFGYFGNTFEMEVIGLQGLSTEDEVGVSDINETIALVKEHQIPAIFIETSISDRTIQAVIEGAASEGVELELGGELYSDAMGEAGTEEGTYIGMYRHNVETIYQALSGGAE